MTWGPMRNMAVRERRARAGLVNAIVVVVASAAASCVEPSPLVEPAGPQCTRRAVPTGVVGANVIDRDDASDHDPSNDGARGYGSDASRRVLERLAALGLDVVALPVPVHARDQRATTVRPGLLLEGKGRARLARMVDDAHAKGMSVAVVPHLTLDDGTWRGELAPKAALRSDEAATRVFLASYGDVVVDLARLAESRCVEVFSLAVELKSLTRDPRFVGDFDALAARVRAVFTGTLTYSANWDEAADALGWSRVDVISVNAFAPLAHDLAADDAALVEGARAFQSALFALALREDRPVWMMEAGFKATRGSFVEPWRWPAEIAAEKPERDDGTQARAYRALLTAARENTALGGVLFWAVPSDLDDGAHAARFEPDWGFGFLGRETESIVREFAAR